MINNQIIKLSNELSNHRMTKFFELGYLEIDYWFDHSSGSII